MPKILITTVPFGKKNSLPLELIKSSKINYLINPLNKKLTEEELSHMISDFDVLIAGTEPITAEVIKSAKNLKLISRVGIGLDNIDLLAARKKGIKVSYTPDAPAPAVAELTIGLMLSLLRSIHISNDEMHSGRWHRFFGHRLEEVTLGIIGVGRIGTKVINHTKSFGLPKIMANDLCPDIKLSNKFNLQWACKEKIYREADIISLHLPLTHLTENMIRKEHLMIMKSNAFIINTARGGIINEQDLYEVMENGHLGGAAIDVFNFEPYSGPLNKIKRCVLTAHMGSMSVDCRTKMEIEATEEALRFLNDEELKQKVPDSEYLLQEKRLR